MTHDWRKWLDRGRRVLQIGGPVVESLFYAREGGKLAKGLAVASSAASALDILWPEQTAYERLRSDGYRPLHSELDKFLCETLRTHHPYRVMASGRENSARALLWADGRIAALYDEADEFRAGPFLANGEEDLAHLLQEAVWGQHAAVEVLTKTMMVPMTEPDSYFGEPGLDWYVERMKHYGDDPASILFVGPTGIGKSTLAKQIGRHLRPNGRTLKIGSARLGSKVSLQDIHTLVRLLKPTVLLLDDADLNQQEPSPFYAVTGEDAPDSNLCTYESLHGTVPLMISTMMRRDRDRDTDGDNYYDGMRPGRIDEVFPLRLPSPRVRRAILLHNFGGEEGAEAIGVDSRLLDNLVERCENLTGAYIAEVARRLQRHGLEHWKAEVRSVRLQAPRPPPKRRKPPRRRDGPKPSDYEKLAETLRLNLEARGWRITIEPFGVLGVRPEREHGDPEDTNQYGGYGAAIMVTGKTWAVGKKKGHCQGWNWHERAAKRILAELPTNPEDPNP